MLIGFLSKPAHRPWLAAIFGLLLVAGVIVWLSA
jgi:hypothetical protein